MWSQPHLLTAPATPRAGRAVRLIRVLDCRPEANIVHNFDDNFVRKLIVRAVCPVCHVEARHQGTLGTSSTTLGNGVALRIETETFDQAVERRHGAKVQIATEVHTNPINWPLVTRFCGVRARRGRDRLKLVYR
jgi:hypothetical protein